MHWLNEHPAKEAVYGVMRAVGAECDRQREAHRRLMPPGMQIAVGGAHIDPLARSEALSEFLSSLRRGETPETAYDAAQREQAEVCRKWNSRRKDYHVHREVSTDNGWVKGFLLPRLQELKTL